ncbi:MAG: Gfo/Idh/MocA family oxidoreductase, partial [Planctomycetota bacterium]|nr:Gfo/Idh/MocA family oxidoreductase [Planctomycetota bacterium]
MSAMSSARIPFGVGVLGATGYIGTPYRAEMRESPDCRIVALAARRRDLLEAAAKQDGAVLATTDWRQVVEHPDVNVVLVATPDCLHHEAVLACAKAGRHVVCEKPVGMTVAEAAEMEAACRQAGLATFVPFWTRYAKVFRRAQEIYQAGTIGEARAVVYRWHNPRPANMPLTWRDEAGLSSAGSIADVGSHACDTFRWLLSTEPVRVLSHGTVLSPAKPDLGALNLEEALRHAADSNSGNGPVRQATAFDYASISFTLANGAVGTLILSHATYLRRGLSPDVEVHGESGSLGINRLTGELTLVVPGESPRLLETIHEATLGNRFAQYVFPALAEQIAGRPTTHPTLADGL